MQFIAERLLDDVFERRFHLDGVPGFLWTPVSPPTPMPLLLLGHPGGLAAMYHRLLARARRAAADGFASVSIELPGSGDRPRSVEAERARADLRQALMTGGPTQDVIDRLISPLVAAAVPEWRSAIDAALALPGISGPVGCSGGVVAVGIGLAVAEPRIAAAGLFAGSFVPSETFRQAGAVTIPTHVLLQWDDEGNDRDAALRLFDALGSKEKTLQANMGGHTGVPPFAGEDAARFFARHLT
jgi:hypothetical protein